MFKPQYQCIVYDIFSGLERPSQKRGTGSSEGYTEEKQYDASHNFQSKSAAFFSKIFMFVSEDEQFHCFTDFSIMETKTYKQINYLQNKN